MMVRCLCVIGKTAPKCTTWHVWVGTRCHVKSGFVRGTTVWSVVNRPYRIVSTVPTPTARPTTMFYRNIRYLDAIFYFPMPH